MGISDNNSETNVYWLYTSYPIDVTYGHFTLLLQFVTGKGKTNFIGPTYTVIMGIFEKANDSTKKKIIKVIKPQCYNIFFKMIKQNVTYGQ